MSENKRVFIAIDVPGNIKQQIQPALTSVKGVQWHPGKNFHITVKFIGEVSTESLEHIKSLMDFVGKNFQPFDLSFSKLKVIESRLRLLIGGPETLVHIRSTLEHNLKKVNLFHEDIIQFEPHITLGKVPRDFIPPKVSFDFAQINFPVNEIILYETIKGQTAAEFIPLHETKLG